MRGRIGLLVVVMVFADLMLQVTCKPKESKEDSGESKEVSKSGRKKGFREVIRDALDVVNCENRALRRRLERGIDRSVRSFTELEPAILEAHGRPLGDLAEDIGGPSRIINWIRTIARETNVNAKVSQLLKSPLARKNKLRCPFVEPKCDPINEKYRRVDGRCNNLKHPLWGASFTPMARDLPAQYDKGEVAGYIRDDLPRQWGKLSALPSARLVSNVVHSSTSSPRNSDLANMAFVFWGQYVAHDVADTAFESGAEGSLLSCGCKDSVRGCAAIEVPKEDFFRKFDRACLGFARAKEVTTLDCEGGREQLNMMSSFVDLGNLYGQTREITEGLRGENGKMATSDSKFLPRAVHPNPVAGSANINFFTSGDERVSEVIGLTGTTHLVLRLHNNIAEILGTFHRFSKMLNSNKRSDAIFEETRKITIAIHQQITYNEFLPLAIGPDAMTKFELGPLTNGYFTDYNPKVNPTMRNEVITTAQRFGHSLLQGLLSVRNEDYSPAIHPLQMRKIFWKPNFYLLFENGFQRGVVTDNAEVCDRLVTEEVRNHLFETEDGNGEDLIARNIQRGRDHGVPPYNTVRASLGLSAAINFTAGGPYGFEHLTDHVVDKLKQVYGHPDDVDLFTGGISETQVPGGIVGPTFAELLGRQFQKLRVGDRFWFENEEHGFTPAQLDEIRKVTLARLMCDYIDGIDEIQPLAMRLPEGANMRVPCSSIDQINFSLWEYA